MAPDNYGNGQTDDKQPEIETVFDTAQEARKLAIKVSELLGIHFVEEGEKSPEAKTKIVRLQEILRDTNDILGKVATSLDILGG